MAGTVQFAIRRPLRLPSLPLQNDEDLLVWVLCQLLGEVLMCFDHSPAAWCEFRIKRQIGGIGNQQLLRGITLFDPSSSDRIGLELRVRHSQNLWRECDKLSQRRKCNGLPVGIAG